jgi:hypothetical protein
MFVNSLVFKILILIVFCLFFLFRLRVKLMYKYKLCFSLHHTFPNAPPNWDLNPEPHACADPAHLSHTLSPFVFIVF